VDLSWFDQIVPCGLDDKSVTSISKETGKETSVDEVIPQLVNSFGRLFQKEMVPVTLDQVLLEKDRKELRLLNQFC
jgi:lipoate-protein ligase B